MSEASVKPDPVATFREGQKLAGCYLLQRRVEGTGNRVVWLAHDEVLGKDVSLHFVPPPVLDDAEALAVLRHEVKRNRQLIHPSILRVYDFVEEGDWAAVSMDAFTGTTLAARQAATAHGFFEPAEIQSWLENICQTLDDAHRIKLAHGDITPENVVIEESGRVRLANFGIGICIKHALGELEGEHSAHQSAQQLEGAAPAAADDVFGAGVLMHRLLVGAPPFSGPDERGAAPGVAEHRAQLGQTGGPIPPAWEKLVASCLARSPEGRPKSMTEVVTQLALDAVEAGAPVVAPTAKADEKVVAAKVVAAPAPEPAAAQAVEMPVAAAEPVEVRAEVPAEPEAAKTEEKPVAEAEPVVAKVEEPAVVAAEAAVAKAEEPPAAEAEPAAAKAEVSPVIEGEPVAAKAEEKPAAPEPGVTEEKPAVMPEPAKIEEAGPSNIVEAPPTPKKVAAIEKTAADREPRSGSPSQPGRPGSAPKKRMLMDDDEDDYAPGEGGSQWKMVAIGVLVFAVAGWAAMHFWGGDEKKDDRYAAAEATPVPEATPEPATPAPVKPTPEVAKTPATPDPTKTAAGEPKKEPTSTAAATPKPDKPAVPENNGKTAELAAARKALDAAEKTVQDAQKNKQDADAALADVTAKIEEKSKSLTPLQRAADEVVAGQKKREADARAATQAAEQAKQAIADKARLSEEARKAADAADESLAALKKIADVYKTPALKKAADEMATTHKKREDDAKAAATAATRAQQLSDAKAADADSAAAAAAKGAEDGKAKLAAREAAANELADLQKGLEDKQRAAADATKTLADAASKREQQAAVVQSLAKAGEMAAAPPTPKEPAAATPKPKEEAEVKTPEVKTPDANKTPEAVTKTPEPTATGKVDPAQVKKDGQAMIDALSEKLKHLGDTPPATTTGEPKSATEPATAPAEGNPAPAEPAPPAQPDTPKAAAAGFVNSLGMKFAPVGDLLFCIWQTRLKDFEAFAKATGLKSTSWRDPGFKQGPEHPVVNVTWNEAILFCKWLTLHERKDNLIAANQEYRLPTDLEWSAAVGLGEEPGKTPEARDMGVPDVYPWGNQWPPPAGAGNYTGEETGSDVAIHGYSDNFPWTSPVGSFPPNKYGLYDMGGNVWQWVMDNWNGESRAKVLRGASWYNGALKLSLLSSCRVHAAPDSSTDNYGFRVIIAPVGAESGGKPGHK